MRKEGTRRREEKEGWVPCFTPLQADEAGTITTAVPAYPPTAPISRCHDSPRSGAVVPLDDLMYPIVV